MTLILSLLPDAGGDDRSLKDLGLSFDDLNGVVSIVECPWVS